ncbi:hypothetical protein [Enhygromyxa salina]|uniref:hypothetical protein n=1 Tax=Enhygromyxa salina TaxID=215803 RepID=UPI0011BA8C3F|nr:hypothetical protein [Enhygromyxa salina]
MTTSGELATGERARVAETLTRLALHDPDPKWLEDLLLHWLQSSEDVWLRGVAATGLGHVARIHRRLNCQRVIGPLLALRSDPEVGGKVEDALEDIGQFVRPETGEHASTRLGSQMRVLQKGDVMNNSEDDTHDELRAMNWDWIPGLRCGPFRFGKPLPSLPEIELARLEPSCEGADWHVYRVGDEEARVQVDDGTVTAVECVRSLSYLGSSELLGLSIPAVESLLGRVLVRAEHWGDDTAMYEAQSLGLTLWVEGGRVESTTVEAQEVPG